MYKLRIGRLEKILIAIIISVISLIIGITTYYAQDNVFSSQAQTKEEAVQKAKDITEGDKSKNYTRVVSDFQGNFVKDTSYAISMDGKEYYGQGYYITYVPGNDLVFCLQIDQTATKLIGDTSVEGSHFYSTLDKETKVQVQKIILSTKDLYNETQNPEYLASGQIMLWSLFGELNYTTDTVKEKIDEIEQNESNFEDLSNAKIEYYQTLGQDLIDVTLDSQDPTKSINIKKEVNKEEVIPGEEVQYTIVVNNDGEEDLTNVVVTDEIDDTKFDIDTVSEITPSKGEAQIDQTTITWNIGDLAVEEEVTLTFNINVDEDLTDTANIYNSAIACADEVDCADDSVEIIPDINKSLEVTKEADKAEVEAGEKIHYTIKVENTGNVVLTNVVVEDLLDDANLDASTVTNLTLTDKEGKELVLDTDYSVNNTDKAITINEINIDTFVTIEFDINTVNPFVQDEKIINTVIACDNEENCDESEVTIDPLLPDLEISKESDKKVVEPGEVIEYTIKVVNTGEIDLTNVVVTDEITDVNLDETTITNLTPSKGSATNTGNLITWEVGDLAVDEEATLTFNINSKEELESKDNILNSATVCADKVDCKDDEVEIDLNIDPKLKVTKEAAEKAVEAGEAIHYTITVTNTGNVFLPNVEVEDLLDDANLDATTVANLKLTDQDGNVLVLDTDYSVNNIDRTITINKISKGGFVTIEFDINTVNPFAKDEQIVNGVTACALGGLCDDFTTECLSEELCDDDTAIVDPLLPDIEITKDAVSPLDGSDLTEIQPGDQVQYLITVVNTGEIDLTNVVVTDEITDDNLDLTTISDLTPSKGSATNTGNLITWEVGDLAVDEEATLTFNINSKEELESKDNILNSATVCADKVDCKDDEVEIGLDIQPGLEVTKEADKTEVEAGESIHYTITVTNTGNVLLPNVIVEDLLDDPNLDVSTLSNLTLTNQDGNVLVLDANYSVNNIDRTITINKISKGGFVTIEFDINTVNPFAQDEQIINSVTACYTKDDCDESEVIIEPLFPDLEITKDAVSPLDGSDLTEIQPGDQVQYLITVVNTGEIDLTNVVVTDEITDDNLDLTTISDLTPSKGSATNTGNLITWEVGDLTVGEEATLTFNIDSKEELESLEDIVNSATVCADKVDCKDDDATITLDIKPELEVTKEANKTEVEAGETIHYKITVTNTGNVLLPNVIVEDLLDDPNLDASTLSGLTLTDQDGNVLVLDTNYSVNSSDNTITINKIPKGGSVVIEFDINTVNPFAQDADIVNAVEACASEELCGDDNVTITPLFPDLEITKDAVSPVDGSNLTEVEPGDQIQYVITVKNTGDVKFNNAVVTDEITDDNLDPTTITNLTPSKGSATSNGNLITWEIGELEVGEEVTLTFNINVKEDVNLDQEIISNTATVCVDARGCKPGDIDIDLNINPDLEVTKSADVSEVGPGGLIHYTITVTNTGNVLLPNVVVEDLLDDPNLSPSTVENIVVKDKGGTELVLDTNYSIDNANNTIIINRIPEGEFVTIEFDINASKPFVSGTDDTTQIINTVNACVTADLCDDGNEKIDVLIPDFEVAKTSITSVTPDPADDPAKDDVIKAGDYVTYTITVTNTGKVDLYDLEIFDVINARQQEIYNLPPVSISDGGVYDNATKTISWTIPEILVGASKDLTFTVQAKDNVVNEDEVKNDVMACDLTNGTEKCDTAEVVNPVDEDGAISLVKSVDKAVTPITGSDELLYTLVVTNEGNGDLENITISDPLNDINLSASTISDITLLDSSGTPLTSGYTVNTTPLNITLDYLAYGDYVTVQFKVTTPTSIDTSTVDTDGNPIITNTAQACFATPVEGENCDDDSVEVQIVSAKIEITDHVIDEWPITCNAYMPTGHEYTMPTNGSDCAATDLEKLKIAPRTFDPSDIENDRGDKVVALGEEDLTYQITVTNTGEVDINDLVVTDTNDYGDSIANVDLSTIYGLSVKLNGSELDPSLYTVDSTEKLTLNTVFAPADVLTINYTIKQTPWEEHGTTSYEEGVYTINHDATAVSNEYSLNVNDVAETVAVSDIVLVSHMVVNSPDPDSASNSVTSDYKIYNLSPIMEVNNLSIMVDGSMNEVNGTLEYMGTYIPDSAYSPILDSAGSTLVGYNLTDQAIAPGGSVTLPAYFLLSSEDMWLTNEFFIDIVIKNSNIVKREIVTNLSDELTPSSKI